MDNSFGQRVSQGTANGRGLKSSNVDAGRSLRRVRKVRSQNYRRRLSLEFLEDRRLLTALFYWANGEKVDIYERTDQYAIKVTAAQPELLLSQLTADNGLLEGFAVKESFAPNIWRLENTSTVGPSPLIDTSSLAVPGVEWLTNSFVNLSTNERMLVVDELVVGLQDGVNAEEYFSTLSPIIGDFEYRPLLGTPDQFVLTLNGNAGGATLDASHRLSDDVRVSFAAPNMYHNVQRYFIPNDALYPTQWHLNNTGSQVADAIAGADINAVNAWNLSTGAGVTIAVLDDGIERTHPDLVQNIFVNPGEVPGNSIDDDGNGYVDDVSGWSFATNGPNPSVTVNDEHGTSVAGVAAGRGNNNIGVAGSAFNAKILPVQIFNGSAFVGEAGAASAMYYAAGRTANGLGTWNAAQVINNSWGGGGVSTVLTNAFTWASNTARAGKGVATFISSGNGYSSTVSFPANLSATLSGVMAVGSSNHRDLRSEYSNYGTALDFLASSNDIDAPFTVGITTTDRTGSLGYNTIDYTNNTVANGFGGTSSASPLAAGVGALLMSMDPNLTAAQVRTILRATADKVGGVVYDANGFNLQYGYGRIDAFAALQSLGLQVASTVPGVGATVAFAPTSFVVNFTQAVNPATVNASDLLVNGIAANGVTLSGGNLTATFTYTTTPVTTQGSQTMSIAADAITRASDSDGIGAFNGTFVFDSSILAVASTVPAVGGVLNLPGVFDVNFNEPINPASIGIDDLVLSLGTVTSAVALDADSARYTIGGASIDSPITITLGAGKVTDPFGNPNPIEFVGNYFSDIGTVAYPVPLASKSPLGSLVYDPTVSGVIGAVSDTDNYTISVDPGQKITVYLDPAVSLKGLIRLYDSSNNLLASATNTVGLDAVIQTVSTGPATDTYRIEVSSDGSATTGTYTLGLILNAREESESHNGPVNSTFATAEDINGSFITLSSTASRGAVLGLASENDFFQFNATAGDTLSIALQSLSDGVVTGALFDPSGVQITTTAGGATNVSAILNNFVVPTTGSYRVRVTAATVGTAYNLVVLKNADFDKEVNDSFVLAQPIAGADGALGYVRSTAFGLGRVYVYTAAGTPSNVIREINPVTGAILNTFPSPTGAPFSPDAGMATTPTSLLVASDANGSIFELNPSTGAVIRTISTTITTIAGLAFLNNEIFVRSDSGTITVLNYATGAVARSFASTTISEDLAASATKLYSTSTTALYEVNPLTGANTLIGTLPSATNIEGLGIRGNELFASNGSTVLVYDLTTLALLRTLTGFTDLEAVGADGGSGGNDDWYSFAVNTGDSLSLRTSTPAEGVGSFVNELNPKIELYNPSGALVVAGTVLGDGRNEAIAHTATQAGNYRVRVLSEGATLGEYFVSIAGNTGTALPPFRVTTTNPINGANFASQPSVMTVDFNDLQIASTLQASDLKVNGINATAVTFVDGDTALFTLPAGLGVGTHTVTIAAGSILDIQNTPIDAFTSTFTVDPSAPRVVATSVVSNAVIGPGSLTYTLTFSEPINVANIFSTGDFTLHGNFRQGLGVNYTPSSFSFNPAGTVLTLNYVNLPDDDYTLTLVAGTAGGTNFTDLAGNPLDGEFLGTFPSGNGVAGGDFVIGFDMDLASETYPLPIAKAPLGSLVYDQTLTRTISSAIDVDSFTLNVDPNQTVSIVVTPLTPNLQPRVELFSPTNALLSTSSASGVGLATGIQTQAVVAAGTYRIAVSGVGGTQGLYSVEVILNAAYELEGKIAGATNDNAASAQNIDGVGGSFINLTTPIAAASRGAVLGTTTAAGLAASAVTPTFIDISTTGTRSATAIGDDSTDTLSTAQLAGFTFPFFGTTYNALSFSTNALITFGGADSSFSNGDLSTSPSLATIAVLWDDLAIDNTGTGTASSAIFWQVVGTGVSQQLIIQWNNVRQLGGSTFFTMQAVLSKDGAVQLNYAPSVVSSVVTSATVGVKAAGTTSPERLVVQQNTGAGPLVGPNLSTRIARNTGAADFYKFDLAINQRVSLALTSVTAGNVDVQLIGTNGTTVLATGLGGVANLNEAIQNFVVSATGTYYARVTGDGGVQYNLVVTKDAGFDAESNNTFLTAQNLTGTQGVLGHAIASTAGAASFDFESGNQGFTVENGTTGLWHRTTFRGSETGHSSVTSFHYGREGGTFNSGQRNTGSIVSPAFTLPSTGPIAFGFNYILQTQTSTAFDTANVQLSTNNFATFTTIASRSTNLPNSATWQAFSTDLSAFAGQSVRIRWIFDSIDNINNDFAGWFVDDVRIGIVGDEDWYSVAVPNTGDQIRFETRTPSDGTGEFVNTFNPRIELYRPDGSLLTSGTGLPDGRNERIQIGAPVAGTYRVRVIGEGGSAGEYFLASNVGGAASVVESVIATGSNWSAGFIDSVDGGGFGAGNGLGYDLASGTTVPNAGVDRIYIQFSQPVVGFDASNVAVLGANVADYAGRMTVTYDSLNMRGIVTFSESISNDNLRIGLSSSITDVALNSFDGDLDAATGSILDFRFNVSIGDASNDGNVNGADLPGFAAAFNSSIGGPLYNVRADWNADGAVNGGDLALYALWFNRSTLAEPTTLNFLPPEQETSTSESEESDSTLAPIVEDVDAYFSEWNEEDEALLLD